MGNFPHKAELLVQKAAFHLPLQEQHANLITFGGERLSILLPAMKSIHSYCTTNRSSHAPKAHVFLATATGNTSKCTLYWYC